MVCAKLSLDWEFDWEFDWVLGWELGCGGAAKYHRPGTHMQPYGAWRLRPLFWVRLQDVLISNPAVKTGITFLLRFGNTFLGGQQWVWYARVTGLQ